MLKKPDKQGQNPWSGRKYISSTVYVTVKQSNWTQTRLTKAKVKLFKSNCSGKYSNHGNESVGDRWVNVLFIFIIFLLFPPSTSHKPTLISVLLLTHLLSALVIKVWRNSLFNVPPEVVESHKTIKASKPFMFVLSICSICQSYPVILSITLETCWWSGFIVKNVYDVFNILLFEIVYLPHYQKHFNRIKQLFLLMI